MAAWKEFWNMPSHSRHGCIGVSSLSSIPLLAYPFNRIHSFNCISRLGVFFQVRSAVHLHCFGLLICSWRRIYRSNRTLSIAVALRWALRSCQSTSKSRYRKPFVKQAVGPCARRLLLDVVTGRSIIGSPTSPTTIGVYQGNNRGQSLLKRRVGADMVTQRALSCQDAATPILPFLRWSDGCWPLFLVAVVPAACLRFKKSEISLRNHKHARRQASPLGAYYQGPNFRFSGS